jgi:hypothetical protein
VLFAYLTKFFEKNIENKTPELQLHLTNRRTLPSSTNDMIGFITRKDDVTLVYFSTAENLCPTSNFDQ